MKVVLVTIFILIILFLSQQIKISIRFKQNLSIRVDLMLISVTFFPNGGNSRKKSGTLALIRPITKAIGFLLRNSTVTFDYVRGAVKEVTTATALVTPVGSLILCWLLSFCSNKFIYSEKTDFSASDNSYEIAVSTEVLFLPLSLMIFTYHYVKNVLRKRLGNVG